MGKLGRTTGYRFAIALLVIAFLGVTFGAGSEVQPAHAQPAQPAQVSIIVDHDDIAQFDSIPDEYIEAASRLAFLFRHASVGGNIDQGLDCLADNSAGRPNYCDRGLPPGEIVADPRYDRSNWDFEFHAPPPNPNPIWSNKARFFIERVDGLPANAYDVVGFKFGYVDGVPGSTIDNNFFVRSDATTDIGDIEALAARHPDKTVMWWTMGLARGVGTEDAASFNGQMRTYAASHAIALMDIADIQSHRPDGTPCVDNAGRGIEALCSDYTEETEGGHLNALGKQRMAKAVWIMMARLAGWQGEPGQSTPTPRPSGTPAPTSTPLPPGWEQLFLPAVRR